MNLAALVQIQHHWSWILTQVSALSQGSATLGSAFRASVAITSAPLLRPAPLPAAWAAAYKACVGFCQIFCHQLLARPEAYDSPLPTPDDFFDQLDSEQWLHGSLQVCAGSRSQILQLLEAFRQGQSAVAEIPSHQLEAALQSMALQVALALATYQALRQTAHTGPKTLGIQLLEEAAAPWLHAATARPNQPPERARLLYPPGQSPPALELFLREESPALSHVEREDLFWTALNQGTPH